MNREPNWIIDSKLRPSKPNVELLDRPSILDALDDALDRKLAVVIAPAGYGKSTALYQWSERLHDRGVKCSWLSLDEDDQEPNQFLAYLVLALKQADVDVGELEVGALNRFTDSPVRSVLSSLSLRLAREASPCVIVLDDYHQAESQEVDDAIKWLAREAPPNLTLIVISRSAPPIGVSTYIANGEAIEIGPEQLRLTKEETRHLLGVDDGAQIASDILDSTEGWPVAVQLARAQLKTGLATLSKPTVSSNPIASYLTEQILSTIEPDVREFLLSVSIIDRFSPELANAIRNENNSWAMINQLQPFIALLVPLDTDGAWYRLHNLFAEYLQNQLRQRDPERLAKIWLRASRWQAEHGYIDEAVKYASYARDFNECTRLILDAGGWRIILLDGIGYLSSLLRHLPSQVIEREPRLLIAKAYLLCKYGRIQEAQGIFDAAGAPPEAYDDPHYKGDYLAVGAMIRTYEEPDGWSASTDFLQDRPALLRSLPALEAGTVACETVLFHFARCDMTAAGAALQEAFKYTRNSGSVIGLNYCYLHAGVLAMHRAEFDVANANIDHALQLAESNFGSDSGLKHMAQVLRHALDVWSGRASRDDIVLFLDTLSYIEEFDGWAEIYLTGLDAAFHLALRFGAFETASEIVERFSNVAISRSLKRLERFTDILKMEILRREEKILDASPRDRIEQWSKTVSLETSPEHWRSYCIALEKLSFVDPAPDDRLLKGLDHAIQYTENMTAHFHGARLRLAYANALRKAGRAEESEAALVDLIRIISKKNATGLILNTESYVKLAKKAKEIFRTHEGDLLSYKFLSALIRLHDHDNTQSLPNGLTEREIEIIEQLAKGQSNKEIARQLELTENTIKFHMKNIFSKLGVNKRVQAISAARDLGLLY